LLLATDDAERTRQDKIAAAGLLPSGWIERRPEGLFFPQAGVIDPAAYCRRLAQRAELLRATAIAFEDAVDGVSVVFHGGARRRFDAAILANGRDASRFFEARTLPLKGVLGQIDWFRDAPAPPQAIAFGPYAAPAPGGGLVVGATFEPLAAGAAPHVSRRATEENIRAAARAVAVRLEAEQSTPRAAARCQTPDRLPVVGALPDWDFYGAAYDDLRVGKRRDYPPAQAAPRRYILAGLGSRGLVTGPYCAAIVAAELSGAPSPVERDVAHALHPARFFIRDLRGARVKPSRGNRG
jgi:tRNA 5-methylaminomethyl-2-thiouridine biosynthesis bifunctional protein